MSAPTWESVQTRAVQYGAVDVTPTPQRGGLLIWPADESRVSLDSITYSPSDDTFAGWSGAGPLPQWEQP